MMLDAYEERIFFVNCFRRLGSLDRRLDKTECLMIGTPGGCNLKNSTIARTVSLAECRSGGISTKALYIEGSHVQRAVSSGNLEVEIPK
jgi:hypothetical protein